MSGTLTHSPDQIIQYLIRDLGLGTLPEDNDTWPIFCSRVIEDPDNQIATVRTAGILQGRRQPTGEVIEHYGVQITVRGTTHLIGSAKIQTIATTFSESVLRDSVTVDSSVYAVQSITIASGPIPLGDESPESKRQIFTLNITAAIRQTT